MKPKCVTTQMKSSWWVHSNGTVCVITEESSFFGILIWTENGSKRVGESWTSQMMNRNKWHHRKVQTKKQPRMLHHNVWRILFPCTPPCSWMKETSWCVYGLQSFNCPSSPYVAIRLLCGWCTTPMTSLSWTCYRTRMKSWIFLEFLVSCYHSLCCSMKSLSTFI